MSRYTDALSGPRRSELPRLPVIDWQKIGASAPVGIPIDYRGKDAPLPEADAVVITWTSAEWSALDHVFVNSGTVRGDNARTWEKDWHLYAREAPANDYNPLWGYYQMVEIAGQRVLLFKSNVHLAHPPWLAGLVDMMQCVLADAKPAKVLSVGTAGGPRLDESLGDTVVTNSGHLEMKKEENRDAPYNNQTVTCTDWFPPTDLFAEVESELLMKLATVCSLGELETLVAKLHAENEDAGPFGLEDLVNEPLDPKNLGSPRALAMKDTPLLTTDFYFIGKGDDSARYSALEMDDAVIGHAAGQAGADYAFFRNISDPLVPNVTKSGQTIPEGVRSDWSSLIYETFGLYTSMNGALLAWAALAAGSTSRGG